MIKGFYFVLEEVKRSAKLSLPLVSSQLVYAINGLLLVMMVGKMGQVELATNVIVWTIYIALVSLSFGLLSSISIVVSHDLGAENHVKINMALIQGLILSLCISIFMIFSLWNLPYFLSWTGQSPDIVMQSKPYSRALSICVLPLNLLFVLEQFLIGLSLTRVVLVLSLLRVPLEFLLFNAFLFGKWGAPNLGLAGIGYAIVCSVIMGVGVLILYGVFSKKCRQLLLSNKMVSLNKDLLFELIRIGLPLSATYFIEMGLFASMAIMVGKFGSEVLAAHQISYQCLVFMLAILFGLSQGTTVRVSFENGRQNIAALRVSAYTNLLMGFVIVLVVSFIYSHWATEIINLSIDVSNKKNIQLVEHAVKFLVLAGVLQLTDSIRLISVGILRGLKDTRAAMYITAMTFCFISFPLSYIFSFHLNFGALGVWWGIIIGLSISSCVLIFRIRKQIQALSQMYPISSNF